MTNVLFTANVKELTVGQGLTLANSTGNVNLGLSGAGLSQFLLNNCIDGAGTVGVSLVGGRLRFDAGGGSSGGGEGFTTITDLSVFDEQNEYQVTGNLILNVPQGTNPIQYRLIYPNATPRLYWLYIASFPTTGGSGISLTISGANVLLGISNFYAILAYGWGVDVFQVQRVPSNS